MLAETLGYTRVWIYDSAVDAMPGEKAWREELEALSPVEERHLLTFEGHVTALPDRDRGLLAHIDVKTMVGRPDRIGRQPTRLGELGFEELIYTPTGPDVTRELRTFASAHREQRPEP